MAWWGKIIGGTLGFVFGGPLGAALGTAVGHQVDKEVPAGSAAGRQSRRFRQERAQTAFFTATFSVLGHLCKVDGRVSESEIKMAETIMAQMDLDPAQRKAGIQLFSQGKQPGFPIDAVLRQLYQEIGHSRSLCRMFMEIQFSGAYADGSLHPAETRVLDQIRLRLRLTPAECRNIEAIIRAEMLHGDYRKQAAGGVALEDAYAILAIGPQASDQEVKKAYRRLMSQHHPDKLVARGMPEEMMRVAAQKTHEIREAYQSIKQARGLT